MTGIRRRLPRSTARLGALLTLTVLGHAHQAAAAEGPIVTANVSAASIEAGISPAVAGAFTYMFTKVVGLGVEVTWVPTLTPELPTIPNLPSSIGTPGRAIFPSVPIIPAISYSDTGGRAVIVSTNLRFEIPTRSTRWSPYVIAGGGGASVKEQWTATLSLPDVVSQSFGDFSAFGFPPSLFAPISVPISQTSTSLALTAGGGVSINLNRQWSADVDLRYLALLGSRDLHIGRYGGGISYRF